MFIWNPLIMFTNISFTISSKILTLIILSRSDLIQFTTFSLVKTQVVSYKLEFSNPYILQPVFDISNLENFINNSRIHRLKFQRPMTSGCRDIRNIESLSSWPVFSSFISLKKLNLSSGLRDMFFLQMFLVYNR